MWQLAVATEVWMILEPCELGSRAAVRDGAHGKHQGRMQGVKQVGRESRMMTLHRSMQCPLQRGLLKL